MKFEELVYTWPENIQDYFIATYKLGYRTSINAAAWNLAVGQSIGNPSIRSILEDDSLIQSHSCRIQIVDNETVKIAFPLKNIDFHADGVSQLLCQVMGGQLDINEIAHCHLIDLEFPNHILGLFKGPKFGISGFREKTKIVQQPLLGGIVKPKTGLNIDQLKLLVSDMVEGGCNFIKEDEILASPHYSPLSERVNHISKLLEGTNVVYSYCINADPSHLFDKVRYVYEHGGNGIHLNLWSGLGAYKSVRELDLPLFLHFQKSGDRIFTNKHHAYHIDWSVICKLAALMGVDSIHTGMIGGYSADDERDVINNVRLLKEKNVLSSLSCGMTPQLIQPIWDKIGADFMATSGGWIHGHQHGIKTALAEFKTELRNVKSYKVQMYILTYNDGTALNTSLEELFNSNLYSHDVHVNIINNHSNFYLDPKFENRVTVYHNTLQPDFGTGHCSRNWNQALVLGFKNLMNPNCDLVICAQDDTSYRHDWLTWVINEHKKGLEFIALGIGDNLCSYTAEAIKKIGLWDERFSCLHFAECDYFLRAAMYLGDKASINDLSHGDAYCWNKKDHSEEIISRPSYTQIKSNLHNDRHTIHVYQQSYARHLFKSKWGVDPIDIKVQEHATKVTRTPMISTPFTYPYFEIDIDNREEKGYYPTMWDGIGR